MARAPGRLDVMGGFADYSGSLVLELPLAVGTWVVAQPVAGASVVICSPEVVAVGGLSPVTLPLEALTPSGGALTDPEARALLTGDPRTAWAAYVAGGIVLLHREHGRRPSTGLRLTVHSDVPFGEGVSSSAALEVAALEAVSAMLGVELGARALALLAQAVENRIVGAPCGVMDQMTAAAGQADHLLELLCQPAEWRGNLPIPGDLEFLGVTSGVRHAVAGADYGTVRTAAFMGYTMVASRLGLRIEPVAPGRVRVVDDVLGGYLANLPLARWDGELRASVPAHMTGQEFLDRHRGSPDPATYVRPEQTYAVRACTEHPIREHARVTEFRQRLGEAAVVNSTVSPTVDARARRLGELMRASHDSYGACGLGSPATDLLVALADATGPAAGILGAKISGGGSGGTVVLLARKGHRHAIEETVLAPYRKATGLPAGLLAGSSSGSRILGVHRLP